MPGKAVTGGAHREEVLALLSVALRPPTQPTFLEAALDDLRLRLDADSEAAGLVEAARRRLQGVRLDREYHRLFLGPTRPVAPPFESLYRREGLYGATTAGLLAQMREAGLEPADSFRLPSDHIALELDFLAQLEARAREARARGDPEEASVWSDRAHALLDGRLRAWLPAFLARLEAGAPESPYTVLVRATLSVLGIPVEPRRTEG